ncbi:MAG: 2-amino-4-hydroxy-6-hydroxymethyldihydropteridine diphosphokinase [Akkermansiaceae bacterium]|nr:2-amino-4-hydroxy-6-hydroxymethyldihydropteridine diphosphokinase [Akkermansiaceae bacterium]
MTRTGIALGSNLGDRLENLRRAKELLASISTGPVLAAPVYLTEPVNCPPGSPDFLNTVVEISHEGTPEELLKTTQAFQHQLGRTDAVERNAPRVIDIDLLYSGGEIVSTEVLELPHPRIALRQFVLRPLADISPDLVLPGHTLTIAEHLENLAEPALPVAAREW